MCRACDERAAAAGVIHRSCVPANVVWSYNNITKELTLSSQSEQCEFDWYVDGIEEGRHAGEPMYVGNLPRGELKVMIDYYANDVLIRKLIPNVVI